MKQFNQGDVLLEHEIDDIKMFVVFEEYGYTLPADDPNYVSTNVWFGFPVWHRLFDNVDFFIVAGNFYSFNLSDIKDRNPRGENDGRRYHIAPFTYTRIDELGDFYSGCLRYLKAFAVENQ